jgi:hypothetical protein
MHPTPSPGFPYHAFHSNIRVQGLQAGLKSLNAEGIKPRVLIIDDGWQMTQVDEDYEGAKTTKAKRPGFLGSRDEEFEESEQAVLSAYADALAGGSELMTTMPALADSGAPLPTGPLPVRPLLQTHHSLLCFSCEAASACRL